MSEIYELKAEMRERAGKGAARAVRRQGKVPAIIYGDKKPPLSISLTYKDVFVKLHGGGFLTTLAMIDVGGEKIRVIPKDYQLDPVRDFPMHVDFLRVAKGVWRAPSPISAASRQTPLEAAREPAANCGLSIF